MSTENNSKNGISDRLKELRSDNDLTQKDIAGIVGVKQQTWGGYERGKSNPSVEVLKQLAQEYHVSLDWLLLGRGSKRGAMVEVEKRPLPEEQRVTVPIYAMPLGAGDGGVPEDEIVAYGTFMDAWLRSEARINPERAFIAPVRGRSMLDLLQDGDLVLGERVEEVAHDDVYALELNGELLVKHVQKRRGSLILRSENPAYEPIEVTASDDFRVIGVVKRRVVQ